MANTLSTTALAVLLCLSAVGARTNLNKHSREFSPATMIPLVEQDDGICNLVVEKQGYACEEHKVCL